jgi:hypothetical protein
MTASIISVHTLLLSAMMMAACSTSNIFVQAMMANPKNLEIEQCIKWSLSSNEQNRQKIRGFNAISTKDICIESKTIVLKQHGNAMQHWLTDINGMS